MRSSLPSRATHKLRYLALLFKLKQMELERRILNKKLAKLEAERNHLSRQLADNTKALLRITQEKDRYIENLKQLLAERTAVIAELEQQLGHPITKEHMQVMLSRYPGTMIYMFRALSVCLIAASIILYMVFQFPVVSKLAEDKQIRDIEMFNCLSILPPKTDKPDLQHVNFSEEILFNQTYRIDPDAIPSRASDKKSAPKQ